MSDEKREVLLREFPVDVTEGGDGRTLEARIVPYNTPTQVVDTAENGGSGEPYMESWATGAFDRQSGAVSRVKVWLNFEHEKGLRGIVGHGVELDSRPDALYGTFRVHDNSDGNKALQMVRDGLLTGISLEAFPIRTRRAVNGVVERVRAHLEKVSLCRVGAYEDAAVLALREEPPPAGEEESPVEPGPEIFIPATATAGTASSTTVHLMGNALDLVTRDKVSEQKSAPAPESEEQDDRTSQVEEALEKVGYEPWRQRSTEEALQRAGYAAIITRAVVRKPWDGAASRFTDEEYQRSCLIDRGGDSSPKERCSLPVREPNGDLNANALGAAASRLNQTRASLAQKASAARQLIRYYRQAEMEPPDNVRALAAR